MYISCLSSATTTLPLPARVKIMLGLLFKKVDNAHIDEILIKFLGHLLDKKKGNSYF